MSENKLGKFLGEVSNWRWNEFWKAEHDKTYSSNDALIFTLVRACAMQNIQAIRLATNRLDGKLATPFKIEMPKVFYLYPNAIENAIDADESAQLAGPVEVLETSKELAQALDGEQESNDLPSLSIRQTVAKMADFPRDTPEFIIATAQQTEQALRNMADMPEEIPMVKSVIAANLLVLTQKRDIGAIAEVFDQIDGKLTETIKLLGEDLYITNYSLTAPPGATRNADGILQLEATQSQDMWANKLGKEKNR